MTYPVTPENVFSAPVSDPLAGAPRPTGNPDVVQQAGHAYEGAGQELERISQHLTAAVGGVVGGAWIGRAGTSCEQAVGDLAAAYGEMGGFAREAAAALLTCARKWRTALGEYDKAQRWATEAMQDERAYLERAEQEAAQRASSGDEAGADVVRRTAAMHHSPLRPQASRTAATAIAHFNQATQEACGKLDSLMAPVQRCLSITADSGAIFLPPAQKFADYASKNWMRHVPGQVDDQGRLVGRYIDGTYVAPGEAVPDEGMRATWARRANALKWGGAALGFVTAGGGQWMKDARQRPDMETDEQVGRAVAAGTTATIGSAVGSAAGRAVGAAIGSAICPGVGTVVGGVVGGIVGGWAGGKIAGAIDDGAIQAAGDIADEAGDWVSDKWDDWTPW